MIKENVDLTKVILSLKVELKKDSDVNISIVMFKEHLLKKENFGIYRDFEKDFTVWISSNFIFDDRQLRLPGKNYINSTLKCKRVFYSDIERKKTLEKLYTTLQHWASKMSNFSTNGQVVLDDEYWYVM